MKNEARAAKVQRRSKTAANQGRKTPASIGAEIAVRLVIQNAASLPPMERAEVYHFISRIAPPAEAGQLKLAARKLLAAQAARIEAESTEGILREMIATMI
ncbi:MAG: hypothetical protein RL088_2637 [Verrucomicrobiota bacterium]|jgi:hypothetical protein